jgi:predicted dinucleotide-binding enzyme
MKIAVCGSGHVGQALARGLSTSGHDVRIASREGNKLAAFSAESGIKEATFTEAIAFAEVVIVAVKGEVAEALVKAHADGLAGKIVLDTTNPISGPTKDGIVQYFTAGNESLLERLQAAAPQARVVKWMNSVGAHLMVKPQLKGGTPSMFICGNDPVAKELAATLSSELGWAAEDVGTAAAGHAVEALCQLWCAPGFLRNDWTHAFGMLRP